MPPLTRLTSLRRAMWRSSNSCYKGLRVGETTARTHSDLQLKSRSGSVHVRDGKGLKARDVPLNRTARQALQSYLATLPPWTGSNGGVSQ